MIKKLAHSTKRARTANTSTKHTSTSHTHESTPHHTTRKMSPYAKMAHKRRVKKDLESRKRAEYLASLPKHPVKRFFYKLHPMRVLAFWFSKRGFFLTIKLIGVFILLVAVAIGGVFAYYRKDLEAIRPEKIEERIQTTVSKYYDRNGVLLWEDRGSGNYRLAVKDNEISPYVKKATIAIEDKEFYHHEGISLSGIARSFFNNSQGNSVQGGSTLTQQLVKQVFLADEANKRGLDGIPRKIKEVLLAIEIERIYAKDQILNLYLNESPYGGRRNGIESAAQTYFGKNAKDLTLAESAMLASIPNEPARYDPYNKAGNSYLVARTNKTLNNMVEEKFITAKEAEAAKKEDVLATLKPVRDQLDGIKAPHFTLMVRDQLERELGKAVVGRGGLTIKTSLDYRIQQNLEESMNKMFNSGTPSYAGFSNGAATVEDVKTGQIVALLGSRDFNYPGFGQDNAAMSYIQPGSTIKPLVFAQLFNNQGQGKQNFGSGSVLADDKSMDKIYGAPLRNADGGYKGAITVRQGLALSRNVPAVKAMHISGKQPTWDTIRNLGDTPYCTQGQETQAGLSSSIGGCGTRQVDHVNAFASLARGGVYKPSTSIIEVKNSKNEVLKKYDPTNEKQVIDPQAAYVVSDILSDDNARSGLYGRNKYGLVVPGVKTATKTGTSDKDGMAKDIWTMSYSPVLAMGVWLGNSDNTILRNGNSSLPAVIIGDVMQFAHKEVYQAEGQWKPGDWIAEPAGIQRIGGEVYPSYYSKNNAKSTDKMTFDSISKKKATSCTPAAAKIEVDVSKIKDPASGVDTITAPDGYDAKSDDDYHKCEDNKPVVTITPSSDGKYLNVIYIQGTHPLKNVKVSVNGTEIANLTISSSGTSVIPNTIGVTASYNATASVSDEALYEANGAAAWKKP